MLNVDEPGPQLGLQGKAALVVGGGFGIGRSAARMLAAQGSRLALVDLDAERVKAASRELSAFGLRADVREPGAACCCARCLSRAGRAGHPGQHSRQGKWRLPGRRHHGRQQRLKVLETNYLHHVEFCSAFAQAWESRTCPAGG